MKLPSHLLYLLAAEMGAMLVFHPDYPHALALVAALAAVVADTWLDQRAEQRRQRAENESVVRQLEEVKADLRALRERLNVQGLASGLGRRT